MSRPGRIQPSRPGTRGRRRRASVSRCLIGPRPREAAQSRRSAFWALARRLARASIQIWTFGTRRCLIGDYQGRARAAPPGTRPPHARWLLRVTCRYARNTSLTGRTSHQRYLIAFVGDNTNDRRPSLSLVHDFATWEPVLGLLRAANAERLTAPGGHVAAPIDRRGRSGPLLLPRLPPPPPGRLGFGAQRASRAVA